MPDEQNEETEDWNYRLKVFRHHVKRYPDHVSSYHSWGIGLYERAIEFQDPEIFQESIEKFQKAIELDPDFYDACIYIGGALSNMATYGDQAAELYGRMIEICKEAIPIEPTDTRAYLGAADGFIRLAKIKGNDKLLLHRAIAYCQQAEALHEGAGAYNLACAYALLHDLPKALSYLEQALKTENDIREAIKQDNDFDNIRGFAEFSMLLDKYYGKAKESKT